MHRLLLETETIGGGRWGYLSTATNLDAKNLIVAIIFSLWLYSIVRFVLGRRRFSASSEAPSLSSANGLKKRELRRIPAAAYGFGEGNIADTVCTICLGEFGDAERVRILPNCNHVFHVQCIETWLVSHSSCPNCRHSLVDHSRAKSEGISGSGRPEIESVRQVPRVAVVSEENRDGMQ